MKPLVFRNRVEAGQLLAGALTRFANRDDIIVLGLPRGGVPVAYEVARKLPAPLDVIVAEVMTLLAEASRTHSPQSGM